MKKHHVLVALAAGGIALALAAAPAHADALYFQGFEANTSGWGTTVGAITREASETGGIPAFHGSYYGEVTNADNAYSVPGYGTGGFTWLNGNGSAPTPYPGWAFSQSISVYVDVATPKDSSGEGFAISMAPSLLAPDGVGCDPAACSDEQIFQLLYTGSAVNVDIDGSTVQTIGSTGWYTFGVTYQKGSTPTSLVTNDMSIYDASGNLLSSTPATADMEGGTLESADLGGPGYIWLPQWQNGFSGDHIAIDDVQADVPEPSSIAQLGAGLLALGFAVRRRYHP